MQSRLDVLYRKIIMTKYFTKGWGSPDSIIKLCKFRKLLANRETCYSLVNSNHSITITNEESWHGCHIIEGKFRSPLAILLPGVVPEDVQDAYFQMILPLSWKCDGFKPICIHLAGTGDHFFRRRRLFMVKPLLPFGIGAVILENPFYGFRKPKNQVRSCLHNVSDIFVMGGCLILECSVLLQFCEQNGFGPLGVTGLSMGGHMASLAATVWPKPLVLVPCLSWSTASSVFTEGVMSEAIDWDFLQSQYFSTKELCNNIAKLCRIVDDPLKCNLTRSFKYSLNTLSSDKKIEKYITPHEIMSLLSGVDSDYSYKEVFGKRFPNLFLQRELLRPKGRVVRAMKKRDKEAIWFMKGIMDEFTHLSNYDVPFDTSLVIAICAQRDAYVPRQGCSTLEDIWPGCTVRYLKCGHVGAYLRYRKVFRNAVIEGFNRAMKKYPSCL